MNADERGTDGPQGELVNLDLNDDASFSVWIKLQDGRDLTLEFMPNSDASNRLLELFTQLATEALSRFGERGVVITTAIAEDET